MRWDRRLKAPLEDSDDAFSSMSVPIRTPQHAAARVFVMVPKQQLGFAENYFHIRANETAGPSQNALRTFSGLAHDQDWFAQAGSLFLHTARVAQDKPGLSHEPNEMLVRDGSEELNAGMVGKYLPDGLLHVGIKVNRIYDSQVRVSLHQRTDGGANITKAVAERFAPMACNKDQAAPPLNRFAMAREVLPGESFGDAELSRHSPINALQ
jgi:hypothetical protein